MSTNDESVSVEEAFGGWPGMQNTETPPAEEPSAETPAEVVVPEGGETAEQPAVTPGTDATPAEPEVPAWKAYGFKDEGAMWTSYQELQRELTRRGAPAPAEEAPPAEEQQPTWQSHQFQALGEIPRVGLSAPQREQLGDLMQVDPKAAALWAYQNQQYMDAGDFKAVQNNWAQADPHEFYEFRDAIRTHMQEQQRTEQEMTQRDWVVTQQREHAIAEAKRALPLMEERSDEFGAWLAAPENAEVSNMLDAINDPARLQQALVAAFYQYAGPSIYTELTTSHQQAAAAEAERQRIAQEAADAAAAKGKGARTQTRTSAAGNSSGESDADEALRNLILNPHGPV
jgi:hypothetical protein